MNRYLDARDLPAASSTCRLWHAAADSHVFYQAFCRQFPFMAQHTPFDPDVNWRQTYMDCLFNRQFWTVPPRARDIALNSHPLLESLVIDNSGSGNEEVNLEGFNVRRMEVLVDEGSDEYRIGLLDRSSQPYRMLQLEPNGKRAWKPLGWVQFHASIEQWIRKEYAWFHDFILRTEYGKKSVNFSIYRILKSSGDGEACGMELVSREKWSYAGGLMAAIDKKYYPKEWLEWSSGGRAICFIGWRVEDGALEARYVVPSTGKVRTILLQSNKSHYYNYDPNSHPAHVLVADIPVRRTAYVNVFTGERREWTYIPTNLKPIHREFPWLDVLQYPRGSGKYDRRFMAVDFDASKRQMSLSIHSLDQPGDQPPIFVRQFDSSVMGAFELSRTHGILSYPMFFFQVGGTSFVVDLERPELPPWRIQTTGSKFVSPDFAVFKRPELSIVPTCPELYRYLHFEYRPKHTWLQR